MKTPEGTLPTPEASTETTRAADCPTMTKTPVKILSNTEVSDQFGISVSVSGGLATVRVADPLCDRRHENPSSETT